jgi:methionine synthase II (cobalamin-independent)
MKPAYNFAATAIGSLPHVEVEAALSLLAGALPEIPCWPQLVKISPYEDMLLMYARPLFPLVSVDAGSRSLRPLAPGFEREQALAAFYQQLWEGERQKLLPTADEARGFAAFCQKLPGHGLVKGQVTGPITLASAVLGADGKALLYDEEIAEAIARGLGAGAGAQGERLAAAGARPIVFLDEPSLTGFGSAFSPLTRPRALALLQAALEEARNICPQLLLGVHCCGNTDWSLIMEAGPDIISLDSFGFGAYLLLYIEQLSAFLNNGGAVAWGAAPTEPARASSAPELWRPLRELLDKLEQGGIAKSLLVSSSLLTPACGLGSLAQADAERIIALLPSLCQMARAWAKEN